MRRRAGVGGLQKDAALRESFRAVGGALAESQRAEIREQAQALRAHVEQFAVEHRDAIAANPALATRFTRMCTALGVDPLVSARKTSVERKGFLSAFGGPREKDSAAFYSELAVQIVEQCLLLADETGGLADVSLIKARLSRVHNRRDLTDDDVARAVETLRPLGGGFALVPLGGGRLAVQSMPLELSPDGAIILGEAERRGGCVGPFVAGPQQPETCGALSTWPADRLSRALSGLLAEGLLWVDEQNIGGAVYWAPGMFPGLA